MDIARAPRSDRLGSRPRRVRLAAWLCAGLGIAAASADASPAVVEVRIVGYRFEPAELRVPAGTTVRWINDEKRTSHSILLVGAGSSEALESERLFPGEHWEHRFDATGDYRYTCGPHPEMQGVVVVHE